MASAFSLTAAGLQQTAPAIAFLAACLAIVAWIFRTGYRLKN
jgi:hypothetical protein